MQLIAIFSKIFSVHYPFFYMYFISTRLQSNRSRRDDAVRADSRDGHPREGRHHWPLGPHHALTRGDDPRLARDAAQRCFSIPALCTLLFTGLLSSDVCHQFPERLLLYRLQEWRFRCSLGEPPPRNSTPPWRSLLVIRRPSFTFWTRLVALWLYAINT